MYITALLIWSVLNICVDIRMYEDNNDANETKYGESLVARCSVRILSVCYIRFWLLCKVLRS